MLNKVWYILFFIFLCCCNKNVKKPFAKQEKEKDPLYGQINNVIDSISSGFPKGYSVNLYTVTHEKKYGNDYIKIATAQFYNKDSISGSYLHHGKIIVLYSKDFSKITIKNSSNQIVYLDTKMRLFLYIIHNMQYLKINNSYKNISVEEGIKMNLFNYSDRHIPEPASAK